MKLFGTPLKLTVSFLVGFVYFSVAIGWNHTWLLGVELTAVIFGLIFLHELGHFFMSKIVNVKPKQITMTVIGGAVEFNDDFEEERTYKKLLISWAGPIVNIIIMFSLGFNIDLESDKIEFWNFLKLMNIVLLAYNILPLYPLDGGKILQYTIELFKGREYGKYVALLTGFITGLIVIILSYRYKFWLVLIFTTLIVIVNFRELKKYSKNGRKENDIARGRSENDWPN